jgi:hypothetical protein
MKCGNFADMSHHTPPLLSARGFQLTSRVALLCLPLLLGSCDRALLRRVINKLGKKSEEKPAIYHEYEGYSPGARRTKSLEDFNRYYYYIAPDPEELLNSDPQIYYREDYEVIETPADFDEEQYWREHPLPTYDDEPNTP